MKLILSIGLFIVASVVLAENEDDNSHPCAQGLYQLPKDKPSCFGDFPRWYHDHASGECKEFSYDGCNKNENNFESKADCDKACKDWHEVHKNHQHHGKSDVHTADCHHEHDGHDHNGHEHHGHEHHHH